MNKLCNDYVVCPVPHEFHPRCDTCMRSGKAKVIKAHGLEFKYFKMGGLWRYIGPISGELRTAGPNIKCLREKIRQHGWNVNYQ